jgi:hypothetical protein
MFHHAATTFFTHPSAIRHDQLLSSRVLSDLEIPSDRNLPNGFPTQLKGPQVWSGRDSNCTLDPVVTLSEDELACLEEALRHHKGKLQLETIHMIISHN